MSIIDATVSTPNQIKELLDKINALKVRITEESGGLYSLKAHQSKWKGYGYKKFVITTDSSKDGTAVGVDNKSTVRRILIGEKEGEALKTEILKTRAALLAVVKRLYDSLEIAPIDGVKLNVEDIEFLKNTLSLYIPNNHIFAKKDENFSELAFGNLSVAEANLMLRKFELNAKCAASQVISYLASNMSSRNRSSDKIDIFYQPVKSAIYLGETYEAEIAIGQISRQLEFSVNVNGNNLPINGIAATYSAKPNSVGTQHYTAIINVKNPQTGLTERIQKEFQYEVLAPKQK